MPSCILKRLNQDHTSAAQELWVWWHSCQCTGTWRQAPTTPTSNLKNYSAWLKFVYLHKFLRLLKKAKASSPCKTPKIPKAFEPLIFGILMDNRFSPKSKRHQVTKNSTMPIMASHDACWKIMSAFQADTETNPTLNRVTVISRYWNLTQRKSLE